MTIYISVDTRPAWSQRMPAECILDTKVEHRLHGIATVELQRIGRSFAVTAYDEHAHRVRLICDLDALFYFEYRGL